MPFSNDVLEAHGYRFRVGPVIHRPNLNRGFWRCVRWAWADVARGLGRDASLYRYGVVLKSGSCRCVLRLGREWGNLVIEGRRLPCGGVS